MTTGPTLGPDIEVTFRHEIGFILSAIDTFKTSQANNDELRSSIEGMVRSVIVESYQRGERNMCHMCRAAVSAFLFS